MHAVGGCEGGMSWWREREERGEGRRERENSIEGLNEWLVCCLIVDGRG